MNGQLLKNFYLNQPMREAVKQFIIDTLKDEAVERTFGGKDVEGIKDCRELVDKSFDQLKDLYGTVEEPKIINPR